MNTYIVKVKSSKVRKKLEKEFEDVGKPSSLHDKIIVNTECSKEDIEKIKGVVWVEEDGSFEIDSSKTQEDAPWSLSVISDNNDGQYTYKKTGKGVDVYVVDSGVRDDHEELKGRVENFYKPSNHDNYYDTEGKYAEHGTAVASCVAGKTVGVAKEATIKNAKTDFRLSTTIKILDKILSDHRDKDNPSVVNMSISSTNKSAYQEDIEKLKEEGVVLVASAGNQGDDEIRYPAGLEEVISVGATDKDNKLASFSSYGKTVDLYAPGRGVKTASPSNKDSYMTTGGTSFSAPYTAGVAALFCEGKEVKSSKDVDAVYDALLEGSRKNVIDFQEKENNNDRLLYSLIDVDLGKSKDEDEEKDIKSIVFKWIVIGFLVAVLIYIGYTFFV